MHRKAPRLARTLACAAVAAPVLLVAGCSSSGSDGGKDAAEPSSSASAKPAPAKYKKLPDPCDAVSKKTVEDVVENADSKKGRNLASADTDSYGSCLWSGGHGKNNANYRALTVSLKRYDSDASLGSGDKQAAQFYEQQLRATKANQAEKESKESTLPDVGQQAVSVAYRTTKKKDQDYRVTRVIARTHNAVVTVDYEGTGFEGAKLPDASEIQKNAQTVAKEAVAALS